MTRIKSVFAAVMMAAIVSFVPQAQAATSVKVVIAGSSALWQSLALAAYNDGNAFPVARARAFTTRQRIST